MSKDIGGALALEAFTQGSKKCKTDEEISNYCQMLISISIKILNSLEGPEFKKGFLQEAAKDDTIITHLPRH